MKVHLAKPFNAFSGKLAGLVYYIDKFTGMGYCRDYVIPERTVNNTNLGNRTRNLSVYYKNLSVGYVRDLKNYADRLNMMLLGHGTRVNGTSMNIKMMYLLKKAVPAIDLMTITPQEIVDMALPIRTIREAVDSGLIPHVARYEELESWIIE
ncbi:MAG: hypothetical protein P9L91_04400 [Candidatus Zophobacter franzmannii]|nr:hypothetical protein [Candidatus Zophobacter franzmannii]